MNAQHSRVSKLASRVAYVVAKSFASRHGDKLVAT